MNQKYIYALGYFDGVHAGHAALLQACREMAAQSGCGCGAVTFLTHPQQVLSGGAIRLINTNEDREEMLLHFVDTVLGLDFTESLMRMPWQDFLEMLIKEHGAMGFVCGSDFRFGSGGQGTARCLAQFCRERNLPSQLIPQQILDGERISSTHIRSLLEAGNMPAATRFLGHPHILSGTVQSGRQLGRTIGVPTANIPYPEQLVRIPFGVYACRVTVDGKTYNSVTNVGLRPTVGGQGITVESWLQNFSGNLYGKQITVSFYDFLRPEYKFPDLSHLKEQIENDKNIIENVLAKY